MSKWQRLRSRATRGAQEMLRVKSRGEVRGYVEGRGTGYGRGERDERGEGRRGERGWMDGLRLEIREAGGEVVPGAPEPEVWAARTHESSGGGRGLIDHMFGGAELMERGTW